MADRVAVCHQSCGKPDLHTDSVRDAKPAIGSRRHSGRLGNNHLVHRCRLAPLQMGRSGTGALFRLGIAGDDSATFHHVDELGEVLNSPRTTNRLMTGTIGARMRAFVQ